MPFKYDEHRKKCKSQTGELCEGFRSAVKQGIIILVENERAFYLVKEDPTYDRFCWLKENWGKPPTPYSPLALKEGYLFHTIVLAKKLEFCPFCGVKINLLPKRCQHCHKKTKKILYWNEIIMESADAILCLCKKCADSIYDSYGREAEEYQQMEEKKRKELYD